MSQHRKIGADTIVKMCMGIGDGENVGIVFEGEKKELAVELRDASLGMGGVVDLIPVASAVNSMEELNLSLNGYDVLFFAVTRDQIQSFGHKPWKKQLCELGKRIGFISGGIDKINAQTVNRLKEITDVVAKRIGEGSFVRVETDKGTNLELSIEGRKGIPLTNILVEKGAWGCLPDFAEVPVAPVEGSSKGMAVVDGMITGIGPVDEPVVMEFADGVITSIRGGKAAQELINILDNAGENARNFAELGLGTNPFVEHLTGTFDDKRIFGTAHIGIGDNMNLGGVTKSNIHLDVLMFDVRIYIDGRLFISEGKIVES